MLCNPLEELKNSVNRILRYRMCFGVASAYASESILPQSSLRVVASSSISAEKTNQIAGGVSA
jgi:hypothetical protein